MHDSFLHFQPRPQPTLTSCSKKAQELLSNHIPPISLSRNPPLSVLLLTVSFFCIGITFCILLFNCLVFSLINFLVPVPRHGVEDDHHDSKKANGENNGHHHNGHNGQGSAHATTSPPRRGDDEDGHHPHPSTPSSSTPTTSPSATSPREPASWARRGSTPTRSPAGSSGMGK
jgi:hypothetical protein